MNWEEAEKYLYDMKRAYEEIGWTGSFGLAVVIHPLIKRYESGERSEELYREIMEIE